MGSKLNITMDFWAVPFTDLIQEESRNMLPLQQTHSEFLDWVNNKMWFEQRLKEIEKKKTGKNSSNSMVVSA